MANEYSGFVLLPLRIPPLLKWGFSTSVVFPCEGDLVLQLDVQVKIYFLILLQVHVYD